MPAGKLKVIEVNGTYYGSQKPETFAKWAADVPDGFIFSLKASRFVTNRKVLAEAGEIDGEVSWGQGLTRARRPSGAAPLAVRADEEVRAGGFRGFSEAAAEKLDGLPLSHVVEVRARLLQGAGIRRAAREI